MKIPIVKPYFNEKEAGAVKRVVKSGWIIQGKKTREFENLVASYVNSKYTVAINSCTSALYLSLMISGIKRGDEVICPSFTFIATPNSIEHIGAKPIFCDIDENTYNINPFLIEEKITDKTKAIMPVDQLGLPYDHDNILKIAKENNLKIIEDAAPSLGSKYKNKKIGSLSPLTCFSFHPRKIITTGEGGMITTNNHSYAEMLQTLRNHGTQSTPLQRLKQNSQVDTYPVIGFNYRMSDIHAAIGIEQMKKIEEIIMKREKIAQVYNEELSKINGLKIPFVPTYAKHVYQTYIVRILGTSRDKVIKELLKKGVMAKPGVDMSHKAICYKNKYGHISLPVTEEAHAKTMLIPIYPSMTEEEQFYVIKSIKKVIK